MIGYREQVEAALRAVAVTSAVSYAWFGRRSQPLPRAVAAALAPDAAREFLIGGLQNELYRSFYTQGRPVPAGTKGVSDRPDTPFVPAGTKGVSGRSDRALVEALSRANSGTGGSQPGWRVAGMERDTVLVVRDGLHVRVPISGCRGVDRDCGAGAPLSIRRPKELLAASPGFYTALGDTEPSAGRDGIELRVYFNISAKGAARLVAVCTGLLNETRIPFDLKVVDHPAGYPRSDAAVLYLDNGGFERTRDSLRAIVSTCAPDLNCEPPAFAQPLAPGVAVGEHSLHLGPSFGTSRCRLVAEGIVAAHDSGARGLPDRFEAVARRFAYHGLDIDAPYLAPGSAGRYEL